jgi:hypothetical protein
MIGFIYKLLKKTPFLGAWNNVDMKNDDVLTRQALDGQRRKVEQTGRLFFRQAVGERFRGVRACVELGKQEKHRRLLRLSLLMLRNEDHFTKTGSGRTQGKSTPKKRLSVRFLQVGNMAASQPGVSLGGPHGWYVVENAFFCAIYI